MRGRWRVWVGLAALAGMVACTSSGTEPVMVPAGADASQLADARPGDAQPSSRDAAALEDAAEVTDAAPPPDAGAPEDAAAPDAEPPLDAGVPEDAAAPDAEPDPLDAGAPDAEPNDAATSTASDAGPPIDAGFTVDMIVDETGVTRTIVNGPHGDPATIGCSDGQREGLVDDSVYPNMAGCLGTWSGTHSLRTATVTAGCGDDALPCPMPAALCAPGWHVCGSSGSLAEALALTPDECDASGGGRYVFAISHCLTQSGCVYDRQPSATYPCFPTGWCSEPVCCGAACNGFGACRDGVWAGRTHIPVGTDQGCGAITSRRAGGVLCCR